MGAITDKLGRLSETKELLKQRLTEKGVDVSNENVFYNLADKVGNISSSNVAKLTFLNEGNPDSFSRPSSSFELAVVDKDGNMIVQVNRLGIISITDTTTIEVKVPCVVYLKVGGMTAPYSEENIHYFNSFSNSSFIVTGDAIIGITML